MLRLIVQKARSHFNTALEFAERDRNEEAIAELNNALELDRSHVNSHIVLGTLYAKLGQIDKAEEYWKEALAIDPRFQKAREYLDKVGAGRRSLPVVRRQRFYMIAMMVFMCVLGAWVVTAEWRQATKPSYAQLQRAWTLYRTKDDAGALEALKKIPKADKDDLIAGQALVLADIIHTQERLLLEAAGKYLDRLDLPNAYSQMAELLNHTPPSEMASKALELRGRIVEASEGAVSIALKMFQDDKATEAAVRRTLDLHRAILGSAAPRDELLKASELTLAALSRNRKVGAVVQEFKEKKIDEITLLKQLTALRREYPDYAKLQDLIRRFADPQEAAWTSRIETTLKAGDSDGASWSLANLRNLWEITQAPKTSERIAAYEKRIAKVRTDRMLAEIRSSHAAKDFEKTVELAQAVLATPIDETSRAVVETILAETQSGLADQRWQWMRRLDWRYTDGSISVEEAERTIRCYPQVEKYLSRKAYPKVFDDMLFYLAMSYRRIGRTDKAHETFQQLLTKYPKSAFVRWVKHYQETDAKKK